MSGRSRNGYSHGPRFTVVPASSTPNGSYNGRDPPPQRSKCSSINAGNVFHMAESFLPNSGTT